MKRALSLILLLFISCLSFSQTLIHDTSKHVEDFANVISQSYRDSLEQRAQSIERETHINIVVASIGSIGDQDRAMFVTKLANSWSLSGSNGAVLIVVIPQQHAWQTVVSMQLQSLLTDIKVVALGKQYMIPQLISGNYGKGLLAYVSAINAEIASNPKILVELDSMQKTHVKGIQPTKTMNYIAIYTVFFITSLLALVYWSNKRSKKKLDEQCREMKKQQLFDSLINRMDNDAKVMDGWKRFNPKLEQLAADMRALQHECTFAPAGMIAQAEEAYTEISKKVEMEMTTAELIRNAQATLDGKAKMFASMQDEVSAVKNEYNTAWETCPELMENAPQFAMDEVFAKQFDRMNGLYADLENAIQLQDTAKLGPLQGSVSASKRKFDQAVVSHRNSLSAVQRKLQYVNGFAAKYRAKIDESSVAVQADFVTPSSRMSFENLVPSMNEMLDRLGKVTNFTYKYAMCLEIETTYNSAVAGFTREMAERNQKQTDEKHESQEESGR